MEKIKILDILELEKESDGLIAEILNMD